MEEQAGLGWLNRFYDITIALPLWTGVALCGSICIGRAFLILGLSIGIG